MTENQDRLLKLDNDKLFDVVKNYRQYGYDDQLRTAAIQILEDRGISVEQLKATGNFENQTYDVANDLFKSFMKNSKLAFIMYLILFASKLAVPILASNSELLSLAMFIVTIFSLVLYFVFLVKSFINQTQFYKAIGKEYGTEGALLYLLLGMPIYMFMYFYFKKQMKQKMNEIA